MAKARMRAWLVAGCFIGASSAAPAWAGDPPSVSTMLNLYKPRQPGVVCSTPGAAEQARCKVELVTSPQGGSGWLLRDGQGRPVRRYFDTNGDGKVDVWSYYQDGVEVYRERSTHFNKVVDEFRWLNNGGMKWGVSSKGDGKIDSWVMISAEELSQEVFQAVATDDFDRLKALWITEADVRALELPPAEVNRIRDLQGKAQAKFQATKAKLALTPQAKWERFEAASPQCVPADQAGTKRDLIKYTRATILYEANNKHDWMQAGEMIQVGPAWRLLDAPAPGLPAEGGDATQVAGIEPALQPLLEELRKVDNEQPKTVDGSPASNLAVVRYNLKRADVLQKILAKVTRPEDREQWINQLADCLSAAAQGSPDGDKTAYERLLQLEKDVVKAQPKSAVAGYVTFREMSADYAAKLSKPGPDFNKIQEGWLARLTAFVQDYPNAEDTADALLQLGIACEYLGKEVEAKKSYRQLAAIQTPDKKPLADKAAGALRRLELEGKPLELVGQTLDGKAFDAKALAGKVVVVYYWTSRNPESVGDFARLKVLLNTYTAQGLVLVSVNLDNSPPEAGSAPAINGVPGVHLFAPGGLDSPLATQYGLMFLPNMFLVNKEGKVVSRTVQMNNLEEEVKKLVK